MSEEQVFIENDKLTLEGLLSRAAGDAGMVICHPHPLMGGSMHNNVVEAIQKACVQEKYSTLRFNFRGVGRSSGEYADGVGEQEDILAACKYLQNQGIAEIIFAGYSFGAWVGAKIVEKDAGPFAGVIFISPPVRYFQFDFEKLNHKINITICGEEDQFCDLGLLKKKTPYLGCNLKIISGADHFYAGRENDLVNILQGSLDSLKK